MRKIEIWLAIAALLLAACGDEDEREAAHDGGTDAGSDSDTDGDTDSDTDSDTGTETDTGYPGECPLPVETDCGDELGLTLLLDTTDVPSPAGELVFVDLAVNPDEESPYDVAILADVVPASANPFQVLLLFDLADALDFSADPVVAQLTGGNFTSLGLSLAPGNTEGSSWHYFALVCEGEGDYFNNDSCAIAGLAQDSAPADGFEVIDPNSPFGNLYGVAAELGDLWLYGDGLSYTPWSWTEWMSPIPIYSGVVVRALAADSGDSSAYAVAAGEDGVVYEHGSFGWNLLDVEIDADLTAVDVSSGAFAAGGVGGALVLGGPGEAITCDPLGDDVMALAWIGPTWLEKRLSIATLDGSLFEARFTEEQGPSCVVTELSDPALALETAMAGMCEHLLVLTEDALLSSMVGCIE